MLVLNLQITFIFFDAFCNFAAQNFCTIDFKKIISICQTCIIFIHKYTHNVDKKLQFHILKNIKITDCGKKC